MCSEKGSVSSSSLLDAGIYQKDAWAKVTNNTIHVRRNLINSQKLSLPVKCDGMPMKSLNIKVTLPVHII